MNSVHRTVIFTHIPKTGGVTLRKIIDKKYLFTPGRVYLSYNVKQIKNFRSLTQAQKESFKVINGHLHFGVHRELQHEACYITMLREPLSRAVSEYNFINSYKHHAFHKEMNKAKYTLEELLKSGKILNMDNCHVRYLCGVPDVPYGGINEEHLQLAIENLTNHFERVGIMEFFDESLVLLAGKLGWSKPFYTRQNTNGNTNKLKLADIDIATRQLLEHYNRYDNILYEKGLALFHNQVAAAGPSFQNEVAVFKQENGRRHFYNSIITLLLNYTERFRRLKMGT